MNKYLNRLLAIIIINIFLFSTNLYSDNNSKNTIIVDIDGSGDYISIQEGIDAATSFDTVLVYPGIYYENIDYSGKNIILVSKYPTTGNESYIDSTIIDGNENGSCVLVNSGESGAEIIGFTLQNGSGYYANDMYFGGGINIHDASIEIEGCKIYNNKATMGGGIYSGVSQNTSLKSTIIKNNHAYSSGGGFCSGGDNNVYFSSFHKCNIYNNYAPIGSDIYNHKGDLNVIVDTFTVEEPNKFYAYSREDEITMDIENHKIEPINNDLYVSPDGVNTNSGLSPSEPLLNIYNALIKIKSDSTHPNTIHVAEGTYSPSGTGEFFALGGKEYISIIGAGKEETILDAEQTSVIFSINRVSDFLLDSMTLQNGYRKLTGGIFLENSSPLIRNIMLFNNDNISGLGKTHLGCLDNSDAILENVTMTDTLDYVNSTAVATYGDSDPKFINCSIISNKSHPENGNFGAIYTGNDCNPLIINTLIADNYGEITSGIASTWSGDTIYVINSTIVDNDDCYQGTIRLVDDSHIHLINTILRNESDTEIYFFPQHNPNSATLEYCNVDGGIDAIDVNNNGTLNYAETNIDQDPLFVGGDPFSYQLSEGSPCIDAGTPDTTGLNLPATDLVGNPRIYNGRVDIGAYEYIPQAVGGDPDTNFVNKLYLFQNKPNPFKNSTEILFITSDYERVENYTLSIYNTKGQLVRRYEGRANNFSFKTKINWDGKDSRGREVAPGNYFYKLEYNNNAVVRKMVKLK